MRSQEALLFSSGLLLDAADSKFDLLFGVGDHGGGAGAGVSLDLHGELLRGDNGQIQCFLIGAVFLYLIDKDLHLALEDGVFLLSGRDIIGDLLKEIINGGHVIAAYAGFFQKVFSRISCAVIIFLSTFHPFCIYQK